MLKVTLVKSLIRSKPVNRKTAYALGLRKISQSNTFEDTPSIRGMIHNIAHLVKVEEVTEGTIVRRRRGLKAQAAAPAKKAPAKKSAPKADAKKVEAKPKATTKASTKSEAKKPAAKKTTTKKSTTKTTAKKTTKE